jgi:ATP-dependent RNA helicase RhlE
VLVFSRTKHGANKLSHYLNDFGVTALPIHGNKSQGARTRALAGFKQGEVRVLVATDIAARGIDIDLLPHVVNFDLPNVPEDYVHRIGRTGRAGAAGEAVSLVSADEFTQLFAIEKLLGHALPRELVDGFEPQHDVPESKASNHRKPSQPLPAKAKPKRNRNQRRAGQPQQPAKSGQQRPGQRRRRRQRSGGSNQPTASNQPRRRAANGNR